MRDDVARSHPLVSVVVPFRDAAAHLPALVAALARQEGLARDAWEVVLVDDGSTDEGPALLPAALGDLDVATRVLARSGAGSSYAARNVGIAAADGAILAFTDADCRPAPTWLAAIVDHLGAATATQDVVAGAVDLDLLDPTNPWELFDHAVHLDNAGSAAAGRVATANMAVHREAFDAVGPFAEVSSGGDWEWSRRARAAGWSVVYDPSVRVSHPTRTTRDAVLAKVLRTSRGQGEVAARDRAARPGAVLRAVGRPLLVHRHLQVATTPAAAGGIGLRARLFALSLGLRLRQVPAFVAGWREARSGGD